MSRTATVVDNGTEWGRTVRRRPWLAALLLGLVALLVACGNGDAADSTTDDAADETSPETSAPSDTEPPETEPPDTEPPDTETPDPETPTEEDDGDGLSTTEWLLIGGIAVAVVAALVGVGSSSRRRSDQKSQASSALTAGLHQIVGASRWLHDTGSVEVLTTRDPERLRSSWSEIRSRMIDLEGQIATQSARTTDQNLNNDLRYLGQCVAGLRSAEETFVSAQLAEGSDPVLLRSSEQSVSEARQRLDAAIGPVAAAARG